LLTFLTSQMFWGCACTSISYTSEVSYEFFLFC